MSTIEKAKEFAIKAHTGQMYGEFPYEKHLNDVVCALVSYTGVTELSNDILCAAWLHDVIEDTDVTFQQIFEEFGRDVARVVFACTDEPGKNRKERHERTYPKLIAAGPAAIAVKLADRIANVKHSLEHHYKLFQMYQKEYSEFRKALYLPDELRVMWSTLDALMVKHV